MCLYLGSVALTTIKKRILFSFTITLFAIKAYLFCNLYIFCPFGRPLQLQLPQRAQIVQIHTLETRIRLGRGIF